MKLDNSYRTMAVLANVQEVVCSVLEQIGGNEIALPAPEEISQDVAAAINVTVQGASV